MVRGVPTKTSNVHYLDLVLEYVQNIHVRVIRVLFKKSIQKERHLKIYKYENIPRTFRDNREWL